MIAMAMAIIFASLRGRGYLFSELEVPFYYCIVKQNKRRHFRKSLLNLSNNFSALSVIFFLFFLLI